MEIACFCQRAYDNSVYTTDLSSKRTDDPCGSERFLNNQITYGTYLNLGGEKINISNAKNINEISDLYIFCKKRKSKYTRVYKTHKGNSCRNDYKEISAKTYNSTLGTYNA